MTNLAPVVQRALSILLLVTAAVFFALHFVHLTADFPNGSPWMDWSKYTDEGWYGDAAIRHFQRGTWYVAGDFNPAAALPVWPFLEALLFNITGVSLTAARALTVVVFGGILLAGWLLIWRQRRRPLAASAAVLLLAVSPFCFVFTRMAIIEPLLILLMLLALLAATATPRWPPVARWAQIAALGLLIPVMVLTKTTAIFLLPAVFWMVFARSGYRVRESLRTAVPVAALAAALWLLYYLALVRPHYLLDYRYLFSANAYTGMDRENFMMVLSATVKDGNWMGAALYPASALAAILALFQWRRLREHPLVVSLLLWIAGYTFFLAYHNNLQPRYYLVVAVPLTLLLPLVFDELILPRLRLPAVRAAALGAAALVAAAIALPDALKTLEFVRTPEYTLLDAAQGVAAYIHLDERTDPAHNPLILSISGSDISLMTGLPSICDDFGTLDLPLRIRKFQPGWYVSWNLVEQDKLDALSLLYKLQRVAEFPAMDDPDRNLLILYKLLPAGSAPPTPAGPKPVTPKKLRTRVGQQPSVEQLEH